MKLPKINAVEFIALLESLGACEEARDWAKGKSLATVVRTCNRGDWLLWLLGKTRWITRKQLVLMACACAEPALQYVKAGEDRPRKAIETARAWVEGKATIDEVRIAAADAADAAYAAYAAAAAASYAAYAADAAAAAAAAASYAAYIRHESLKHSADVVRKMLEEL